MVEMTFFSENIMDHKKIFLWSMENIYNWDRIADFSLAQEAQSINYSLFVNKSAKTIV